MPRSTRSTPSPALLVLLAAAAELRATGATWDTVAAAVKRSPETCRQWPRLYPEDWRRLFRAAEERFLTDLGTEAAVVLRNLLRSGDERIRRDVGRFLFSQRALLRELEVKAQDAVEVPGSDGSRIAAFLDGLSPAERQQLIDEQFSRWQRRSAAAAPLPTPDHDPQVPEVASSPAMEQGEPPPAPLRP